MNVAPKINPKTKPPLYDRDFVLWTEEQAKLLRAHKFDQVDLANLVEEVESLGRSDRRGTNKQIIRLQLHLLKRASQPERRGSSWQRSSLNARLELLLYFKQSPSLLRYARSEFCDDYDQARKLAAKESHLPLSAFPDEPPFTLDRIPDDDFWPD